MLGWGPGEIPLLIVMPALLLVSAFCSGSETALFGMRGHERAALRSRDDAAARAARTLLANPRLLLITILLLNMLTNVTYFVVSSILLLRLERGPVVATAASLIFLMTIILGGEVVPKLLASSRRMLWLRLGAIPLLTVHRLLAPARVVLARGVIDPMFRLMAPRAAPRPLNLAELSDLLDASTRQGLIRSEEQELLREIVHLSRRRVRDVMTPRVRIVAVPVHATRREAEELIARHRHMLFPVYGRDLDDIVGMLDAKAFLLDRQIGVRESMRPPQFVPELAKLDHLIDHFRTSRAKLAVAVDELGQTAGVVSIHDVVDELVEEYAGLEDLETRSITLTGLGRWRVPGELSIHDFIEAFEVHDLELPYAATLGGFIQERLGRLGGVGETLEIPGWRLTIAEMQDGTRVTEVDVEMTS